MPTLNYDEASFTYVFILLEEINNLVSEKPYFISLLYYSETHMTRGGGGARL